MKTPESLDNQAFMVGFKENFKETDSAKEIAPEAFEAYIAEFYGDKNPEYFPDSLQNNATIKEQVTLISLHMTDLGLANFAELMDKFDAAPHNENDKTVKNQIKTTMEYILFVVENNPAAKKSILNNKDRVFACGAGTLTNLQAILAEISLGQQGIDAYITSHKRKLIEQTALEMYKNGEFSDIFPDNTFEAMEIHNVSSLVNSVAEEYNLLKKTKQEDQYLKNITSASKEKLSRAINKKLNDPAVIDNFIDTVAMDVVKNLPAYDPKQPKDLNKNLDEAFQQLKLGNNFSYMALVELDTYEIKSYKAHVQDIMKDMITINLHERKVLIHPDIEFIKLRVEFESETEALSLNNLKKAKDKGLLEKAMKYIIDRKLRLEGDDSKPLDPIKPLDPLKYAIDHNIKLDGKDAKQYALGSIIGEYLNTKDQNEKQALEKRYEEVANIGNSSPTSLLYQFPVIIRHMNNCTRTL